MTSAVFDVSVTNDNTVENDEDFILTIVDNLLPAKVTHGITGESTIIILKNDCKLSFSPT